MIEEEEEEEEEEEKPKKKPRISTPETKGLILRLRSRLKGINVVEEVLSLFLGLPTDIVIMIIEDILVRPSPESAATLFALAGTHTATRNFLRDEDGFLERKASRALLGAVHTRSRSQRELGLETLVAQRYRWVIDFLNTSKLHKLNPVDLQALADENLEKRPEHINAWPWWYFRLLSNWRCKQSLSAPFSNKSDGFTASIVTIFTKRLESKRPYLATPTNRATDASVPQSEELLKNILEHPSEKIEWESGSGGSDLVIIPLDTLWKRTIDFFRSDPDIVHIPNNLLIGEISISVTEFLVYRAEENRFRKEVVITGAKKMEELIFSEFNILLRLHIRGAFLPLQTIEFLENLPIGGEEDAITIDIKELSLRDVFLERPTQSFLNLWGISKNTLEELTFGPSNLLEAPLLACPSPLLKRLTLVSSSIPGAPLKWSMGPFKWSIPQAECYPELESLSLSGDIRIWEEPTILSIPDLPKLHDVVLLYFQGSPENVRSLADAFLKMQQKARRENVTINMHFSTPGASYRDALTVPEIHALTRKGVMFIITRKYPL